MWRILELRIPPVAVFLGGALGMWFLRTVEFLRFDLPGSRIAAAVLFAAGVFVAVRGVLAFRSHDTTVNPVAPDKASTVVRHDVFRFTRNPMYLGLALVLTGFGLVLESAASLAVVPVFASYLTVFQIIPEERALSAKFGDAFDDYRAATRRWF